uniref:F-box domain-containing protein n=2 Tax=Setaria italica TaxID=4555 RepID=K3YLH9_SETIT
VHALPMATAPPTDGEVDEGLSLHTDAFVEILMRLPPSCRRWARLVCRHWRDIIDQRTPRSPPPKVLAFFTSTRSASAYVVNDLEHGWGREVWGVTAGTATGRWIDVTAVGTCNGLLCLCDNRKPGGRVALLNPATGETLRVPPLPVSYRGLHGYGSGKRYTFGFHPATGAYKILHLPCRGDATAGFNVLQAFTLGAAAWRDVAVPGASCCLGAGLVRVGGAAHWVTKGMERVVSFDLGDERVAFDAALPVAAGPGSHCRLVEFHGRLGLAVSADRMTPAKTEVWVLGERAGGRQGWSRRYSVRVQGVEQRLAAPHFAHGGEYVLTVQSKEWGRKHVYAHRLRGAGRRLPRGEVRSVRIEEPGMAVAYREDGYYLETFAYVETTEPLSVYKIDQRAKGVHRQNKSCP